jgi:EAL domain-containing protein (putative c-di-GMP-specific phosphodiesterase class I)
VALSVDDFGTGYSSLGYLKRFPIDELKIDRSFVADLPGRPADTAIVHSVIALGACLGMTVVAEGVENEAQRACLARLGCHHYQGFLFSPPLPGEQFVERLRREQPGVQGPPAARSKGADRAAAAPARLPDAARRS